MTADSMITLIGNIYSLIIIIKNITVKINNFNLDHCSLLNRIISDIDDNVHANDFDNILNVDNNNNISRD